MNHYTLSELAVGQSENFTVTVTQEMMEDFYRLTGDDSPIHRSEEYAAGRVYLPGEHCLLHGVEAKFARPVFIGDTLTVKGTVTEVNDTFKEITVRAEIFNQEGKKVTRGLYRAGLAR